MIAEGLGNSSVESLQIARPPVNVKGRAAFAGGGPGY